MANRYWVNAIFTWYFVERKNARLERFSASTGGVDRNRRINHSRPSKEPIRLRLLRVVSIKHGKLRRASFTINRGFLRSAAVDWVTHTQSTLIITAHGPWYPVNELYVLLLHQLLIVIVNGSLILCYRGRSGRRRAPTCSASLLTRIFNENTCTLATRSLLF